MTSVTSPAPHLSRSTVVAASAEKVYDLVSDLPGMGRLSPENTGGSWLGGATGPEVGARFRGRNRNGWRFWTTVARVEDADPGRRFAFRVSSLGIPVARWAYDISPAEGGVTVTESWTDLRPGWFKTPAGLLTGVLDREASTARNLEKTLKSVKEVAEL